MRGFEMGNNLKCKAIRFFVGATIAGSMILSACQGVKTSQPPVVNNYYNCQPTAAAPCPLPQSTPTATYLPDITPIVPPPLQTLPPTPTPEGPSLEVVLACSELRSTEEASYGQYLPTPMAKMYAVPPYNLVKDADSMIMDSFMNRLTKQQVIDKYFSGDWKNAIVPCNIDVAVNNHRYHVAERWLSYNHETRVVSVTDLLESCISYCPSIQTPMAPTCTPYVPPTRTPIPPTWTPIPPTWTPIPPTWTPIPPTETGEPPNVTQVPIPSAVPTDDPLHPHPTPTP
jgi:hypothetical protein